jgi:folate-binding protein YgfZ
MGAMQHLLNGVASLTHSGLIRAQGEDAAKFLHNQFTQDFVLQGQNVARLAGFCSAKGRLQASFIGFKRSPTDILLVCDRALLATTLKRLSMFVMRAKLKLEDASAAFSLYGLAGSALQAVTADIAAYPDKVWAKTDIGEVSLVNLYPADGVARALWLAPADHPAPAGVALSEELWAWSEVRSGIATLTPAIADAFVPQMLNYESVGGVNFKKGCYPGQEVVARSQFRGTLKRRAYLAHADVALKPGDELFLASDAGQPCGQVAQAAASPEGGFDAIVVMQLSAVEAGELHLGAVDGPPLQLSPPPYPLLADI